MSHLTPSGSVHPPICTRSPTYPSLDSTSVAGKALTRVIIDFEIRKVVYDRLVEPPGPITDYLTRCVDKLYPSFSLNLNHRFSFSGITVEVLGPTYSSPTYAHCNSRAHGASTLL
jgi:hypothetical protein